MVTRVPVGAHYGIKDWTIQRVTALIMAIFTLVFGTLLVVVAPDSYTAWRGIFAHGAVKLGGLLFFVSLFYHAWIGVRDIWMDYVKPDGLRLLLLIATAVALTAYAGWAANILWSVR